MENWREREQKELNTVIRTDFAVPSVLRTSNMLSMNNGAWKAKCLRRRSQYLLNSSLTTTSLSSAIRPNYTKVYGPLMLAVRLPAKKLDLFPRLKRKITLACTCATICYLVTAAIGDHLHVDDERKSLPFTADDTARACCRDIYFNAQAQPMLTYTAHRSTLRGRTPHAPSCRKIWVTWVFFSVQSYPAFLTFAPLCLPCFSRWSPPVRFAEITITTVISQWFRQSIRVDPLYPPTQRVTGVNLWAGGGGGGGVNLWTDGDHPTSLPPFEG